MKTIGVVSFFFFLMVSQQIFAQTFVGTIVASKGDVKVLSVASAGDPGPFARYEGKDYSYSPAKLGKKVRPGEVIQSGPDGKAKIVYPNGDHFIIGSGTSLELPKPSGNTESKDESTVNLLYGRVRALVSKGGPRSQMKVKTPTAVAGVRGTDFFTRANHDVGTQLTVLRGEVLVAPAASPEKSVPVKTGFMVETSAKKVEAPAITEVTREELKSLQKETAEIKPTAQELKELPKDVKSEVAQLAIKTKEAVLADIKTEDPKLFAELNSNKNLNTEDINSAVVDRLFEQAPAAIKKKPTSAEVDSIGKDVYDKYYKSPDKKK